MTTHNDTRTSHAPTEHTGAPTLHRPDVGDVHRAIVKRHFCTLATVSPAGRPHVAGVLYEAADRRMYVSTLRSSRKARNVAADPHVAVVIPVRRVPIGGPPSAIQFQTTATLLGTDDPEIIALADAGSLSAITGHGELDLPDGCFIRVDIPTRLHTYGLGMPLRTLVRDPLGAAGIVDA